MQRSQQGIELTREHRAIRKCTSCQPFTREPSGQDGVGSQEGTECPRRGVSSDYVKHLAAGPAAGGSDRDKISRSSLIRGPISNQNCEVFHRCAANIRQNKHSAGFGGPFKIKGPISGIRRSLSGLRGSVQDLARPIQGLRGVLRT